MCVCVWGCDGVGSVGAEWIGGLDAIHLIGFSGEMVIYAWLVFGNAGSMPSVGG